MSESGRKPGGQPGNQNATKGRVWRDAINRALKLREKSRFDGKVALDILAEQLLTQCDLGDISALKELGDRLEGKAAQSLELSGDKENPLCVIIRGDDANL